MTEPSDPLPPEQGFTFHPIRFKDTGRVYVPAEEVAGYLRWFCADKDEAVRARAEVAAEEILEHFTKIRKGLDKVGLCDQPGQKGV